MFRNWPAQLGEDIELCAVQLPGRAPHAVDTQFADVAELCTALVEAILPLLDRPYVFYGHSFGALVAFELLRKLEEHGHAPARALVVAAHPAPACVSHSKRAWSSQWYMLGLLRSMGVLSRAQLANPRLVQHVLALMRSDLRLQSSYVAKSVATIHSPLAVFGGRDDRRVRRAALEAWQAHTHCALPLEVFLGGDFFPVQCEADVVRAVNRIIITSTGADRMGKNQASVDRPILSAERCAWVRALGTSDTHDLWRNPDYMARDFVGASMAATLRFPRLMKWMLTRNYPGYYFAQIVRTKHVDATLLDAVSKQGVMQVLLLGAGYDTRPYRFHQQCSDVHFVELDFPGTQARKIERVRALQGALPEHVTYVPIDFNKESLTEALARTRYDPALRTLIIWEGTSMYLNPDAVEAVFELLRNQTASQSSIIFDYILRSVINGDRTPYGAEQSCKLAAASNEPYRFGFDPASLAEYARSHGLTVATDYGPDELVSLYLSNGLKQAKLPRMWGFLRMANVKKP